MSIKVGINGFGRMGRLAVREAFGRHDIEFVHINDPGGDAEAAARLLKYDSVHRAMAADVGHEDGAITVDGKRIDWSRETGITDVDWAGRGVDVLIECSGKFRSVAKLQPLLDAGVPRVVVSAPVKDEGALNIVMGVNDERYDSAKHRIVTAASCTTNCIAPVVDVIHGNFGLKHGNITTIHAMTNTQNVLDNFHKDPRRARAASLSLIPTTTGSARAIIDIFPDLKGRIDGVAVRVPLASPSLTDCVFEVEKKVTVDQVNAALREAAEGRLKGILGYEEIPLVSADYVGDRRSSIVDAPSTMVVNDTQVKIFTWYDNEIGYVNRLLELAMKVA